VTLRDDEPRTEWWMDPALVILRPATWAVIGAVAGLALVFILHLIAVAIGGLESTSQPLWWPAAVVGGVLGSAAWTRDSRSSHRP
jgi:hypothetical protein